LASQIIVVLFAVALVYSMVDRFLIHPPVKANRSDEKSPTKIEKLIQVSVRNECGARNIAMDFTFYLRKRGFDVVETTNGSTPDRQMTVVVDATGNYNNALRVAQALGVKKENVLTKLDPHSYVDVEVLIGKDFQNLKPNESIE
jgi:hypothetical protein